MPAFSVYGSMSHVVLIPMLKTLKLLLPALIPSWRFFDVIAPSPRIEFVLLNTRQATVDNWREFRPRPMYLPMREMLKRMFWNPRWNETLFLVSCSERLMESGEEHSAKEIARRIQTELSQKTTPFLQFRLVF